jgi:hypothetical protein
MKENDDFAELDIDLTQILKQILEIFNGKVFINFSASEYGQEAGSSEYVNGSSYSIKREEFID